MRKFVTGDWYPRWQVPTNIPDPTALSPEQRKHRDKEDAQKLVKLTKQLAKEEIRLSALRVRARTAQNGPILCVVSGRRNDPLDQLQYGKTDHHGVVTPVKLDTHFDGARAAVQLANCYTRITEITEDIRALKASQEGAE